MKYLFVLSFVFYSISSYSQSEDRLVMKEYFRTLSLGDDYPYVYSFTTKGGKMIEHYCYFKKDRKFVLAYFQSGTDSVKQKTFHTDVLFDNIKLNLKSLIKLRNTKYNAEEFHKKFGDSLIYFNQIGIRVKGLHFNHFQQADKVMLSTIKDEQIQKARIIINSIATFFEEQIPGKLTK